MGAMEKMSGLRRRPVKAQVYETRPPIVILAELLRAIFGYVFAWIRMR